MAKPKLCLIPATIGDKVYSILPSNGVGDFDFTRADGSSPTGITRINAQGLIEEVASGENRLNYSLLDGKVVGCPHLLLEPQRTNLIPYSENFTDASWSLTGSTITSDTVISPDGTLNASTLIGSTANSRHGIKNTSSLGSVDASYTIFVKAKELRYLQIASANSTNQYVNFDLLNGVFVVGSAFSNAKMEDYGNGWYKCTVVSDNQYNGYYLSLVSGLNATWLESWVMPNNTDGLYIYGAMLEQGSYPTSYIKTTSAAVTRAAETCNGSGDAATFNDSEGVLMAEISALADDGNFKFISISDGTTSNRVSVYFDNLNKLSASVPDVAAFSSNVNIKNNNKVAFKYKSGGYSFYVNGFELGTSTSTAGLHSGLNTLNFDFGGGSDDFYGNTKQIQYFDSALSDTELEQLTSWDSFRAMAQAQLYSIQ